MVTSGPCTPSGAWELTALQVNDRDFVALVSGSSSAELALSFWRSHEVSDLRRKCEFVIPNTNFIADPQPQV